VARVLIIEDDPTQLEFRKLLLERRGWTVETAATAGRAWEVFCESAPDAVVMDLRVPKRDDGLDLIRRMRERSSVVRIVVLSGWPADLSGAPESSLVDHCLAKPVQSQRLVKLLAQLMAMLLCMCVSPARAAEREFSFRLGRAAEVVAELDLSSPGSDWGAAGREAAVATVTLDSASPHQVVLWAGAATRPYRVFLGNVAAGEHRLGIRRDPAYSAEGSGIEIAGARFRDYQPADPEYAVLANAPILYARADTAGRFTDVPLLMYCEKLEENGGPVLQYSVVFSNEDGGTSTRALMARWGRTTDVEYVYKAWPDGRGAYQGKDHKELEFAGRREGAHPVLLVKTENNMVGDQGFSPVRYQLAPALMDLGGGSRERVMDADPLTYAVMSAELRREGKLRPFGRVERENIADPRNYLFVEARLRNSRTAVTTLVRRRGENAWRSSDLGRLDYAIARDGPVRTAIELPPGTTAADIEETAFQCLLVPDDKGNWPPSGTCSIEAVARMFLLGPDYRPGPDLWSLARPVDIQSGQVRAFSLTKDAKTTGTYSRTPVP
jgi:CheY-like chemotaxis protein